MQDHKSANQMKEGLVSLPVGRLQSYLTLFSTNKQFTRLWFASIISQLGNWFNYIAIFVLLTKLTGSGQAVSWFLIAKFIPTTILNPTTSVIVDRFPHKIIMINNDLLQIFIILAFLLVKKPEQM